MRCSLATTTPRKSRKLKLKAVEPGYVNHARGGLSTLPANLNRKRHFTRGGFACFVTSWRTYPTNSTESKSYPSRACEECRPVHQETAPRSCGEVRRKDWEKEQAKPSTAVSNHKAAGKRPASAAAIPARRRRAIRHIFVSSCGKHDGSVRKDFGRQCVHLFASSGWLWRR